MKRILSALCLLLALTMTIALVACDNSGSKDTTAAPGTAITEDGTKAPAADTSADNGTNAPVDTTVAGEDTTAPAADTTVGDTTVVEADVKITTAAELRAFAAAVNAGDDYYDGAIISIEADIDLSDANWTPIDGAGLMDCIIEGNGHVINGMKITAAELAEGDYGYGFIGKAPNDITIQNITFANATIEPTSKHAGCVIGDATAGVYMDHVTVDNLYVNGGVGNWGDTTGICLRIGGLIGCSAFGGYPEITNCTVKNSKLIGYHNIAGLVGCVAMDNFLFENNTVEKCELHYSAGYSDNYDEGVARYFADPFYNVTGEWETYHGDEDKDAGNVFTDLISQDIAYEKIYKDSEGKTADYDGDFPV